MPRCLRPLVVVLLAGACALDPIRDDAEPVTGPGTVYALVSVNGANVPTQVVQAQTVVQVTRGALTLAPDSSWIMSYVVRTTGGSSTQQGTVTTRGRWTLTGSALQLAVGTDTVARYRGSWSATDVAVTDVSVPNGDQFGFRR